jgi:hypothetical protein
MCSELLPRCDNIPEDSVRLPYIVSIYGEVNQQRFHGSTAVESCHPEGGGDMFSERRVYVEPCSVIPQKVFVIATKNKLRCL